LRDFTCIRLAEQFCVNPLCQYGDIHPLGPCLRECIGAAVFPRPGSLVGRLSAGGLDFCEIGKQFEDICVTVTRIFRKAFANG
jgi:hypothetical protein